MDFLQKVKLSLRMSKVNQALLNVWSEASFVGKKAQGAAWPTSWDHSVAPWLPVFSPHYHSHSFILHCSGQGKKDVS